jgi:hypothetical protein
MIVIINGRHVKGATDPSVRYPGARLWTNGRHFEPAWQWSAHFDLHPIESEFFHPGIKRDRPEAWDWYVEQDEKRPIYLLERHRDVPAATVFPRRDVQLWAREWNSETEFRTGPDWMIAFALMQRPELLVLHNVGVNVAHNTAWQAQHGQGIGYWIAAARFLGVEVVVEGPSVFAPPAEVYGYEHGGRRHGWRHGSRRIAR